MDWQALKNAEPKEEDTYYELLGEWYVHGMKDGKTIELQEDNGIKSMRFEIR